MRSATRNIVLRTAPLAGRQLQARSFASPTFKSDAFSVLAAAAAATSVAGAVVLASSVPADCSGVDAAAVKAAIVKCIEEEEARREDGTSIGPTFVRLAWHCSGTFDKSDGSGGSNGCRMRFYPEAGIGANAGLATARAALDPLKKKFPGLSSADLYTYAGAVAVEHMGGPAVPFTFGRSDASDGSTSPPDGRLPNADMGSETVTAQHLRDIFYRMGFDDREIVALSGAHALGRCHEDASGYWGPWTNAETTFSNEYFRLLKEEKWVPKTTESNSAKKCPWKGPNQFEDKTGTLMMLPSDIVLTKDAKFDEWVIKYKDDEELFFAHFATAFGKLLALGVTQVAPAAAGGGGLFGTIKGLVGL